MPADSKWRNRVLSGTSTQADSIIKNTVEIRHDGNYKYGKT